MAQQRSTIGVGGYKQETVYKQEPGVPVAANDHHQSHHPHPGPSQHLPHQRPSSVGHPQHHPQQPTSQHSNAYQPAHLSQYTPNGASQVSQHSQEVPYYSHASPYSATSAAGPYTSAATETPDVMAAAGMARPHYPAIYHTPQSNSPASISSPSGHDQYGRQMYNQAPSHLQQQQSMNYPPPPQAYPPMPQGGNPSPYAQQAQQHHQGMGAQSSLLMSHQAGQHMQHPSQQQMTASPRGTKQEGIPPQLQQRSAPAPQGQAPSQHPSQQMMSTAPPNGTANGIGGAGVSPSTNPGPIPATTPLVVRQDNNGVQWIAFEYSRDRVKMEYTIRCDVESVNVENLSADFKNENCVYPRACCDKSNYRGNRFTYETDCNTVGWGLAELNPCLRGKRGLIQRAVDSWRNSNSDPKYRSRRVRRMAKINHRKINNIQSINAMGANGGMGMAGIPLGGPDMARAVQGGAGLGAQGGIASQRPLGGAPGMPGQLHHHHAHPDGAAAGGPDDGSGPEQSMSPQQQHANQQQPIQPLQQRQSSNANANAYNNNAYQPQSAVSASSSAVASRYSQAWPGQQAYPTPANKHDGGYGENVRPASNLTSEGHTTNSANVLDPALFPPVKHPQFLHVADERNQDKKSKIEVKLGVGKGVKMVFDPNSEAGRTVAQAREWRAIHPPGRWFPEGRKPDVKDEILDSARLKHSVWPRSWVGRAGAEFADLAMVTKDDIDIKETYEPEDGREVARRRGKFREGKRVRMFKGVNAGGMNYGREDGVEVEIPRMTSAEREVELGINELGFRMGWAGQSRALAGRKVFLQRALDMYRAKIAKAIEDEEGLRLERYPVFDMRRARREFQEKWGPKEDE